MNTTNCPHANHVGTTVPHPELRHICSVCGGPRVMSGAPTRGGEVEALRAAKDAYTRRTSWRFGAGCSGAFAAFASVVGLALLRLDSGFATTAAVAFLLLAAPFALVFVTGLFRSKRYSKELRASVDTACARAVREVALNAPRPLHAGDLAALVGSTEAEADRWLTELSVEGALRSEITEDGQVVYSPTGRLRIDSSATAAPPQGSGQAAVEPGTDADLEARFAELARRESQAKR